tara:strand:+ start:2562 stop:3116 length:555 start_codon:yes stop_codon:yes gene_type:complete
MKLDKIILILLISITLGACSNKRIDSTNMIVNNSTNMEKPTITRSHLGAVLGGTTGAMACLEMLDAGPYVVASCTILGSFAGSNLLYDSDYDLHNAVFVDHLNNGPGVASYTNWYNNKTGSSGTVKINRSYAQGPLICKEYESNFNIKNSWPVVGIGNQDVDTRFGIVCQMPDGRWVEKGTMYK